MPKPRPDPGRKPGWRPARPNPIPTRSEHRSHCGKLRACDEVIGFSPASDRARLCALRRTANGRPRKEHEPLLTKVGRIGGNPSHRRICDCLRMAGLLTAPLECHLEGRTHQFLPGLLLFVVQLGGGLREGLPCGARPSSSSRPRDRPGTPVAVHSSWSCDSWTISWISVFWVSVRFSFLATSWSANAPRPLLVKWDLLEPLELLGLEELADGLQVFFVHLCHQLGALLLTLFAFEALRASREFRHPFRWPFSASSFAFSVWLSSSLSSFWTPSLPSSSPLTAAAHHSETAAPLREGWAARPSQPDSIRTGLLNIVLIVANSLGAKVERIQLA